MRLEQDKTYGLTDEQVNDSRREHGWNILTPVKKQPLWRLYLEKYRDPIIQILLVAAAISLVLAIIENKYIETIGIFMAIFLATTVGFIFEMDAAKKFDVLTQLNEEQKVKVVRNGQVMLIPRKEIVVGDVVLIETGDEVPADGILNDCNSLQIDESMLTGEPITTKRGPLPTYPGGGETDSTNSSTGSSNKGSLPLGGDGGGHETYSPNYVMRSTMVMNGRGRFVVTAIGDETEIGKVARTSTEKTDVKTPLNLQLDRLGKFINKFGFSLSIGAAVLFLVHDIIVNPLWQTVGQPDADYVEMAAVVLKYFMMAVSLIVMAVPEGLPMAVTLSLALNMRRMLKSNNLVRKLHACETMGAVTVICTDKTGTLTQNKMQVAEVYQFGVRSQESGVRSEELGVVNDELGVAIAANTTANIGNDGNGIGNPTEVALLLWLQSQGIDYKELRASVDIIEQIPFSTETKQMTTKVRMGAGKQEPGNGKWRVEDGEGKMENGVLSSDLGQTATAPSRTRIYIKGAPEIILAQCDISDTERKEVEQVLLGYQQRAMRTLALAYSQQPSPNTQQPSLNTQQPSLNAQQPSPNTQQTSPNTQHPAPNTQPQYTLQAIFGISDPIRPDVPAAVKQCNDAGIEVKIVTGDVDATAREIGRQIGSIGTTPQESGSNTDSQVISGAEFSALSDEEALERAKEIKVMSRARPQDKQRLVQLLQKSGAVVAVTGDGTNDAPALNYAHVGLSLGSGTNVAKEASDMTLLDDSFGSIAKAVMWGRSLYKNLQRFLYFQLTVNVAALLLVIAGSLIGTEMPLTVTQILWVNLIMDTFAALALSSLAPSREVMKEKPRRQTDFILTRPIMFNILGMGLVMFAFMFAYLVYCEYGIDLGHTDSNKQGVDIHELTRFFTVFVMMQMWNLFNARTIGSRHNCFRRLWAEKGLLVVIAGIVIGQWAIVTFGGEMFRCEPLSATEWIVIIASTSLVMWIGQAARLLHRQG